MPKPFDATLKHLLERYPGDWLKFMGIEPDGPVQAIDADLATVAPTADKVFRIGSRRAWLTHLELQASYKSNLPDRIHLGNTLLHHRHRLPVQSVAVLLRPEADGRAMTGVLRKRRPPSRQYLEFHYDVLRVWQLPVDSILAAGLGTLPLAPLTDDSRSRLPAVIKQIGRRLDHEAPEKDDASIWAATYVLMGLRYSLEFAAEQVRGVRAMKESVTYQAIVEEGREEGRQEGHEEARLTTLREVLLDLGERKFGKPDRKTIRQIEAIDESPRLKRLTERMLAVEDWKELLKG